MAGWKPTVPERFIFSQDMSIQNTGASMNWTRLYAPDHPFPTESDAVFHATIELVVNGKTEISFGAAPRKSTVIDRRVVGHGGDDDVGITFYEQSYRHGGGCWFQNGRNIRDNVSRPCAAGSKVTLRWIAASRTLEAELDGVSVGSVVVPDGDYIFAATCEGPGTMISSPTSFAHPPLVLTVTASRGSEHMNFSCTNLAGEVAAEVCLPPDVSIPLLHSVILHQVSPDMQVQRQLLKLIRPDGTELPVDSEQTVTAAFE